jgi:hypothetical protein
VKITTASRMSRCGTEWQPWRSWIPEVINGRT